MENQPGASQKPPGQAINRQPTIELQRRTGRSGTQSVRRPPDIAQVASRIIDPSDIPRAIPKTYAQEGFDPRSSIIACNFPPGTSVEKCRNFLSWLGPIIRIDQAPSVGQEMNFTVSFASPAFAKVACNANLTFEDDKTHIYSRFVDEDDSLWKKVTEYIQSATSIGNVAVSEDTIGRTSEDTSIEQFTKFLSCGLHHQYCWFNSKEFTDYNKSKLGIGIPQIHATNSYTLCQIELSLVAPSVQFYPERYVVLLCSQSGAEQAVASAGLVLNDAWVKASDSIKEYVT